MNEIKEWLTTEPFINKIVISVGVVFYVWILWQLATAPILIIPGV